MVQVAPKSRTAICVQRPRLDAGNLQPFIPIGIEDQDLNDEGAVFLLLGIDSD